MKIISHNFIDEVGYTEIVLKDKNGIYVGTSSCHPEDMKNVSEITGGMIAEYRAYLKALNGKLKEKRNEIKIIKQFISNCKSYKKWNEDSNEMKMMYRQLNMRLKEEKRIEEGIESLSRFLQRYQEEREIILTRLEGNNK